MKKHASMPQPESNHSQPRFRPRTLWTIWGIVVALIVGGLIVHRLRAIDGDFANTNHLIYLGCITIWLLTILFGFFSHGRRGGLKLMILSLIAGTVFFSAFRLDRLDGELRPQFSWRWKSPPELPSVARESVLNDQATDERFISRDTDALQFLGPRRNASWPECQVETDWTSHSPSILWKQPIGEGWSSFAIRGDIAITMEQRDAEEWVSAYDINNGSLLWKYVMPGRYASPIAGNGPRSTPIIHGNFVFAGSAISRFVCLDFISGKEIWSADLNELVGTDQEAMQKELNWGRSGSPIAIDSMVVVPLGGTNSQKNSLIAFDCASGDELWRSGGEQVSYSSPTIMELNGIQQIVYASASSLSGFATDSGKLLWRVDFDGLHGSPNVAQPIRVDDQHLFFSKGYGVGSRLIQVKYQPGESSTESLTAISEAIPDAEEWSAKVIAQNKSTMRTKFTNPVVVANAAYGLSDGILECIDLRSLERKWKRGRYHHGQVLLLGDTLLIFAEDGRLVLVPANPDQHSELAEFPLLSNVCWNLPALSGDRLIVRNATEAACVQLHFQ